MKGYHTLNQFIKDYRLYKAAKIVDLDVDFNLERKKRETITSLTKKRIDKRLVNSTKQFKDMIKRNNYSKDDLIFIAVDKSLKDEPCSIEDFLEECFDINNLNESHYKKLLSSKAFKTGKLKKLNQIIPLSINTREDILRFIKGYKGISKSELNIIINKLCKRKGHRWVNELLDEDKIYEKQGLIQT